jgi:hypothetical protein
VNDAHHPRRRRLRVRSSFHRRSAWAQAAAELSGRVTDESDAVLPGVTVTATQTDTGFTRTVVTDAAGTWVMPNLPTGPYRLEVSLQGFRSYVQTGIVLQVDARPTINAGHSEKQRLLLVSFTERAPKVRIFGEGKTTKRERQDYEQSLKAKSQKPS